MGRKRRLISARGKFANKYAAHPRYAITAVADTTTIAEETVPAVETNANEDIKIIAKQVEAIAQEVVVAEEKINEVVSTATPTVATTAIIKPKTKNTVAPPIKKAAKTKTKTTKTRRTSKTAKK